MKKYIYKIGIILLFFSSYSIDAQSQSQMEEFDEFLMSEGGFEEIEPPGSAPCDCGGFGDLTFVNSLNALDVAFANEALLTAVRDRNKKDWIAKQQGIIKYEIEKKFNKLFDTFEDAQRELFIYSEQNNIVINAVNPRNKYGGLKSKGFGVQRGYLSEFKLLQLRELEIKAGNIHNPEFGYLTVDGVPLKDIKNIEDLSLKWNNTYGKFRTNYRETSFNNSVYQNLQYLGQGLTDEVLLLKNLYYNNFDEWEELNYMQFLINYENIKRLTSVPYYYPKLLALFNKFKDTDKATSPVIESYALRKSHYPSLFRTDYDLTLEIYELLQNPEDFNEATHLARKEAERLRMEAEGLTNLMSSIDISNFLITNLIKELKIDIDAQKNWLYAHRTEAGKIDDFLDANRSGGVASADAKGFAKGILEVDRILDGQFQIKSTGKFPQELDSCCPGGCCPDQSIYGNDPIIKEFGIDPIQSAIDGTFNILVSATELIGSDNWVGSRIRKIMLEIGVQVSSDVENEYLAAVYRIRKRDGVLIVEHRPGLLRSMLDLGLDTFDMVAFLSPSKGGGAFLAIKANGITIASITKLFRGISETISSSRRIIGGNTSRGIQALSKKISRGDLPYQGLKATQEQVEKIIQSVMLSKNRLDKVTRNQQGIEVIDIFDTVSKRGIRLIKSTNEFDTFINYN